MNLKYMKDHINGIKIYNLFMLLNEEENIKSVPGGEKVH